MRMFITLSTIFVPINTGLMLALALEYARLIAGTELPLRWIFPLGARPLEGEHDCRLGLPFETGSTEDDRALGAPGRPLVAESGLSGSDVLKLGGASREKPGMSEGFHGLDLTVGEEPLDGTGFFDTVGDGFEIDDEDLTKETGALGALDGVDGRRVGVEALDVDLGGGTVGREVGVDDLAVALDVGVEDLAETEDLVEETVACLVMLTVGLAEAAASLFEAVVSLAEETVVLLEGKVAREVGVEDLEVLDVVVNVGRPVGVAGLDPGPPDDEGLRITTLEEFNPGEEADCFETKLLLVVGSCWRFAS